MNNRNSALRIINLKLVSLLFVFVFAPVLFAEVDIPGAPEKVAVKELGSDALSVYIQNGVKISEDTTLKIIPVVEEKNRVVLYFVYEYPQYPLINSAVFKQTLVYQKEADSWTLSATFDGLLDSSKFILNNKVFTFSSYFPLADSTQLMSAQRKAMLKKRLLVKKTNWFDRLIQKKQKIKPLAWLELSIGENSSDLQVAIAVVEQEKGVKLQWLRKNNTKVMGHLFPKQTSFRNFILKGETLIFTAEDKASLGTYSWNPDENIKSYFSMSKTDGKYDSFPKGDRYYALKDPAGLETFLYLLNNANKNDYFYSNAYLKVKNSDVFSFNKYENSNKTDGLWFIPDLNDDGVVEAIKIYVNADDQYGAVATGLEVYLLKNKQFLSTKLFWEDFSSGADKIIGYGVRHSLSFDINSKSYPKLIVKGKFYQKVDSNELKEATLSTFINTYQWNAQDNKIKLINREVNGAKELEAFKKANGIN